MKQVSDFSTIDMLPGGRGPGRPKTGKALTAAERKAKSRAAKADTHATVTFTLTKQAVDGLREYMKFKDMTQDQVIERLLTTQLLRKR